jgi:NADPH:quinone reductase-like Zn-dependent oxidoreductase
MMEAPMKAIVYSGSSSPEPLAYQEIEKPIPGDDEVLIQVHAAALNPADWRVAFASPLIRRAVTKATKAKVPRPGHDMAGIIEAVGKNVTRFKLGDAVFGTAHGAFAEYACAPEARVALKPEIVTFEEAAAVPVAGITALQGLRDHGKLQPGQKVLINGAAGGIGTYAVQIAKAMGAGVTAVCSTRNVEMVRSLGADRVVDYTREDFTKGTERYDLILDNVANRSHSDCRRVLKRGGMLVTAGAPKNGAAVVVRLLKSLLRSRVLRQNVTFFMARINTADLTVIADMLRDGKVRSVIDRRFRLSQVTEGLRYVQEGHARAKVVIEIGSTGQAISADSQAQLERWSQA